MKATLNKVQSRVASQLVLRLRLVHCQYNTSLLGQSNPDIALGSAGTLGSSNLL